MQTSCKNYFTWEKQWKDLYKKENKKKVLLDRTAQLLQLWQRT